jgi:FAD/FMN-containing dehydrogenase
MVALRMTTNTGTDAILEEAAILAFRSESEQHIEWARKVWGAMLPFLSEGVYVNYLGEGEGEGRVMAAYGGNYQRLATIKSKYDPTNLFRLNQNIKPSA